MLFSFHSRMSIALQFLMKLKWCRLNQVNQPSALLFSFNESNSRLPCRFYCFLKVFNVTFMEIHTLKIINTNAKELLYITSCADICRMFNTVYVPDKVVSILLLFYKMQINYCMNIIMYRKKSGRYALRLLTVMNINKMCIFKIIIL